MNLTAIVVKLINQAFDKETANVIYTHHVNFIEAKAKMKKAGYLFLFQKRLLKLLKGFSASLQHTALTNWQLIQTKIISKSVTITRSINPFGCLS